MKPLALLVLLLLAGCAPSPGEPARPPVAIKQVTADDILRIAGLLRDDGVIPPIAEWTDWQRRTVRWGCVGSLFVETTRFDETAADLCARGMPELSPVPAPRPES